MEFIKLNTSEQNYGKKNLLYSEMELLNMLKRFRKYKELRKEELALKSLLKKTVKSLKDEIRNLDDLLPEQKHSDLQLSTSGRTPKKIRS